MWRREGEKVSPVTEFFTVEAGLTFQEFNRYINSLDHVDRAGRDPAEAARPRA